MTWLTFLTSLTLLTAGCLAPRPLKGGRASTAPGRAGGLEQSIAQGENASQPTRQTQETLKVRTYTLPAGSLLELPGTASIGTNSCSARPASSIVPSPIEPSAIPYQLSTPVQVTEREETRATTQLGAAQKDTARELTARLASLKGIVWVGVGLFLFGLASLVWPPLKALVGSVTTSAAMILGGLALMVLPTLIVGHELLLLGGVALAVGGWFLAHRHGELRGQVNASAAAPRSATTLTLQPRAKADR